MRKIAVFVEGQSELITLRQLLMHVFESVISFNCVKLYKRGQFEKCPYTYHNPDAKFQYHIYNVGNDVGVLDEILMNESNLWELGFERIIGLRDMYSSRYKELSGVIDEELNKKFQQGHFETLQKKAQQPEQIFFCFSIMEIEAWFLGLHEIFQDIDPRLTAQFIADNIGHNLALIDPEYTFFKPADIISQIFNLVERRYDKHAGDVELLCSYTSKMRFAELLQKPVCKSFNNFHDALIIDN